jgi:hypothetical protein
MKNFIYIIICLFFACSNHRVDDKASNPNHDVNFQQVENLSETNQNIIELLIKEDSSDYIEFPELYPVLKNRIQSDENEILLIAEYLKSKGFKVSDWGRGNYPPLGPRIISITLIKGNCKCIVDKIYYSTTIDTLYTVSERIKCLKARR